MKQNRILILLAAAALIAAVTVAPALGAPDSGDTIPVAQFADRAFVFSSVVEGTEVVHDFVVQNSGGADLLIHKIKTG